MTDIANLVLLVDSSQVDNGSNSLDKLRASSKNAEQATTAHGVASKALTGDLREIASAIATMQGPLGGVASRFSSLGGLIGSIGPAGAIAGAAFAAISFASEKAVLAFAALEQQQITLQAVLNATGGASGQTAAGLEDMARGISASTLATDQQVRSAEAILLTFRGVSGDTFKETLKLSQDLASVGFGDMSTAARALGRTLEDPLLGMQALRREGIVFTEAQKQQVKNFLEVGNVAGAQRVILDQVTKSVGGTGSAAAGGLTGAWHAMGEATEQILQAWGKQIAQGTNLEKVLRGIADAAHGVAQSSVDATTPQGVLDRLQAQLEAARQQAATGITLPHSPDSSKTIKDLEDQVAAQKQVVAQEQELKKWDDRLAENGAIIAAQDTYRDKVKTVGDEIQKTTDIARQSDLQQAVSNELRKDGVAAASSEGEAIARLVTAHFNLLHSAEQAQVRVSLFADASPKTKPAAQTETPKQSNGTKNDGNQHRLLAAA